MTVFLCYWNMLTFTEQKFSHWCSKILLFIWLNCEIGPKSKIGWIKVKLIDKVLDEVFSISFCYSEVIFKARVF